MAPRRLEIRVEVLALTDRLLLIALFDMYGRMLSVELRDLS